MNTQNKLAKAVNEMALKRRHVMRESYHFDVSVPHLSITDVVNVTLLEINAAEYSYDSFMRRETMGTSFHNDRLMFENISQNNIQNIKKRLRDEYQLKNWQIQDQDFYNNIKGIYATYHKDVLKKENSISLLIPVIEKNREIIINVLRQEGYYLIQEQPIDVDKMHKVLWTSMLFVPYKQEDVRNTLRESKWLFHTTSDISMPKILSHGLKPKESDGIFKYQPRIYLWNEDAIDRATRYARQMYDYACDNSYDANPGYTIVRIDARAVIDNMPVYYDPLIQDAFFVNQSIDAKYITRFRHVIIDDDIIYKETEKRKEIEYISSQKGLSYNSLACAVGGINKYETIEQIKPTLDDNGILHSDKIYKRDAEDFMIVLE